MMLSRWLSSVLVLVCVSLVVAETEPPANDLLDNAELFSKAAREEALPVLKEIRDRGKNLSFVIETLPAAEKLKPTTEEYAKWATERAKERKVKGVYLLVYKSPGHFELLADKKTAEKAFTDSDRKELSDVLSKNFESKDFDQGLKAGATFVRDRMKANLTRTEPTTPPETGWKYWLSLIAIFGVLIWVGIAAVRGVWNGGIGKGFMPAFMTALIGATVGLWLYENVISKSGGGSTTKSDDGYSGAGQGKDF